MTDLISRHEAVVKAQKLLDDFGSSGITKEFADMIARSYINDLPSAQPEIIRCKDCKYHVIHTLFGRSQAWCERLCDEFDKSLAHGVESDDYCSRAERRSDE